MPESSHPPLKHDAGSGITILSTKIEQLATLTVIEWSRILCLKCQNDLFV